MDPLCLRESHLFCNLGWDPVHGPSVYGINLGGSCHKKPFAIGGSGSSYIYGYCDANYKEGMTKEECIEFTKNCMLLIFPVLVSNLNFLNYLHRVAISLAMSRDGSSGGTIRLAVITKDNVDRIFIPGDKLPTFWEG